jgi:hypothetical protein
MVGIVSAAALLLVVAGLAKLRDPLPARSAMVAARLPGGAAVRSPGVARAVGAGELVVGAVALVVGGPWAAALLAVAYLALAAMAARLLAVAAGTSCGCFGGTGTPISRWHLVMDLGFAAAALLAVALPTPGLPLAVVETGWQGGLLVALVALLAYAAFLMTTALPGLAAAGRVRT